MIAVTLGDPLSCNVELIHLALVALQTNAPIVFMGSHWHWQHQSSELGFSIDLELVDDPQKIQEPGFFFCDTGGIEKPAEELSEKERGRIAVQALMKLKSFIQGYEHSAKLGVLTAPIDKASARMAEFHYPGHTEFFADLFEADTVMILAGPKLRVALVTNHLALSEVSHHIRSDRIEAKAHVLYESLTKDFGIKKPRIAVTGLNPHCSDSGLFGHEEEQEIEPAIATLNQKYGDCFEGPLPADTAFYRAYNGEFDCVLAMYHDQALGPLKTVHFDSAINVTGGLPILRASPDHGPASALYLKNEASPLSFENAFRYLLP